jgi:hypothetical protein
VPLTASLEASAITLPLDIVLTVLKAAKGNLDEETKALMQIELASALCALPGVEEEVIKAIMKDACGWAEGELKGGAP